jgi:hypothetical protein
MPEYILQGMYRDLECIMRDKGTGADRDVTVAGPAEIPEGWYWYGQRAKPGHTTRAEGRYLLIRPHPDYLGEPLAQPVSFERRWGMTEHKGNNNARFALWTARGPNGYSPISDIFNRNSNPKLPTYVCVGNACLEQTPYGDMLWSDKGRGTGEDGSMWTIVDDGVWKLFRGVGGYDKPQGNTWRLKMSAIEIIEG